MRFVVPVIAIVACVEEPSGPSRPEVSSNVARHDFPLPPGMACFDEIVVDVDPDTAGDQFECSAWYTTGSLGEVVLPACIEGDTRACWRLVEDPSCTNGALLATIDHQPSLGEPAIATIECLVE